MNNRLNLDGLVVSQVRTWTCTLTNPPKIGEIVRVLNQDGCDAGKCRWNPRSHLYFYGWAPLDAVPPEIKARILARYDRNAQPTMSSYEWMKQPQFKDTVVLDPDGWDRSSIAAFDRSMHEQITEAEFIIRLQRSTVAGLLPARKHTIHHELDFPRTMEVRNDF